MSIQASVMRRLVGLGDFVRHEPSLENLAERRLGFYRLGRFMQPEAGTRTKRDTLGGIPVDIVVNCESPQRTIVYAHGGGFVYGGNNAHMHMLSLLSKQAQATIIAIDYRLAPEDKFPAALEDVDAVLDAVDEEYSLVGDSAGGNLVLSVAITRRDRGLSMPKCIVSIAPALDGTFSGHSIEHNKTLDQMLTKNKLEFFLDAYAGEHDKKDARISPLFADVTGLPPVLLHVSGSELLYSDSIRMHEKIQNSGGTSELFAPADMWHVWHMMTKYIPESREAVKSIAEFIQRNS